MRSLLALILLTTVVAAAAGPLAPYVGRPVADIIDEFRDDGEPFAYSTSLVGSNLKVKTEPEPGTPFEIVTAILKPHGLKVSELSGVYLIVRDERAAKPAQDAEAATEPTPTAEVPLENVVVSASRYAISRDIATSRFSIDQRTIQNMPDIGEDPIRVTQRLPGAAASGGSAVAHFRGGETGEIGIMLNGQTLFDPFHIRDYQSVFSAIDARAIDGVEIYTGGFPVRYGDRMSGLVLMDSLATEDSSHNEIGLSVFNTSLLTAGRAGRKSWLFSARRGNLDIVIDPKFGQPSYFDVFGEFAYELTPRTRLSVNTLFAEDSISLVLETEPTERDQIESDTRNAQLWLRLDSRWSEMLSSTTVLSAVDYSNRRTGFANDIEKTVATVDDAREVRQVGFRQDWLWSPSERHWTQWGIHATSGNAKYNYSANAQLFGVRALYEGRPTELTRSVFANPKGGSYAFYVSDRWRLSERSTVEWGLRWDDQTYTNLSSDSQLSPRFSFLYRPWEKTELRFSVGRYFQSQPIQSLQVEDDVTNFWPAQRADHIILGVRHLMKNDTTLRLEVFNKDIGKVRPRYENLFEPLGLMPELQPDRVRLAPSSARAQGVELSFDRTKGRATYWGSYTWSKVTDRIEGANELRSWDQTHSLQGGFEWRTDKWNFSAAGNVHTGWPTSDLQLLENGVDADGEAILVAVPGARNALRLETFASVDVRMSRKFDVRRGSLLAFVEVSNLFDRHNECCLDWDVGENAAGDTVLERDRDFWMPLLPAIGVLWEF